MLIVAHNLAESYHHEGGTACYFAYTFWVQGSVNLRLYTQAHPSPDLNLVQPLPWC